MLAQATISLMLAAGIVVSLQAEAEDVSVNHLTSFYTAEFAGNDENGVPKGWPAASAPLAPPLLARGATGDFLLTVMGNRTVSRAATVQAHYQTESVLTTLAIDDLLVLVPKADGSTLTSMSQHRMLGNLVQRNDGRVVGIIIPPRNLKQSAASSNALQLTSELLSNGPLEGGALYTMDWDGTHPVLLENSVGTVHFPVGFLIHDATTDKVFGIDEGPNGNGRIFQLNTDNSVDILYEFTPSVHGLPQMPNAIIVGSDGKLYGLLAYNRGISYHPESLTAAETATGILYSLDPTQPVSSFKTLHTFTLAQGELNAVNPARYNWTPGNLGESPALSHLAEGANGWLYGGTSVNQCQVWFENSYWQDARSMSVQLCWWELNTTDNLRYFVYQRDPAYYVPPYIFNPNGYPNFPTGVTNWPYMPYPFNDSPQHYGTLFRIHKDTGEYQLLHRFSHEDGASPRGPIAVGADGAIYGTTLTGGNADSFKKTNGQPAKVFNGVLYRINPQQITLENNQVTNSGVDILQHFVFNQHGNTPLGVVRGKDDRLYGATLFGGQPYTGINLVEYPYGGGGTLFVVDTAGTAIKGTVLLTATPAQSKLGETVELTWTGSGVSQCEASSALAEWDGSVASSGSIELTPPAGTHYLSVACRDDVTGLSLSSATNLRVDVIAEVEDDNRLDYGNGGSVSWAWLLLLLSALLLRGKNSTFLPTLK